MPFNLIMKRKVFATVQVLCSEYEEKFHEKLATASLVNVLIAEALQHRRLIPEDFIECHYGCEGPINCGFTPKARCEKTSLAKLKEQTEKDKMSLAFRMVAEQWSEHPDPKWRSQWIATAKQWKEKVPNAKLVLALAIGEAENG